MEPVCVKNSSLLLYSKSHKVWAFYCLPFQQRRGNNQPVGGFRPPVLFRVKVVRNKKSKFFLIVIWQSFMRQIEWELSRICTMSLTYWNNASNIPFSLFFQRNSCTRESDGAIFWPNFPNHVLFEGLQHLFAGRQDGKSRFDVSLKYWKMPRKL